MINISGDSLIQGLNESGYNFKSEILVVTMDDNLKHPYFIDIQVNRDNVTPAGSCILIAPKEKELSKYWINYFGTVIVSFKMQNIEQTNTNTEDFFNNVLVPAYTKYQDKIEKKAREKALETGKEYEEKERKQLKQNLINNYYNFSFIGKVSKIKEKGKNFIIYLNDVGWKFMQKVPKEFRNSFIAGQSLDDAFQAMCEFMGVEFAYSIEDLNEYNFSADGYSIEKEGQVIEDVPQILKEWAIGNEEESKVEEELNLDLLEDKPGLAEYDKKNSKKKKKNNNSNTKISDINSSLYKTSDQKDPTKQDPPSKEESEKKDKEKTLEDKINEYQEEFDEKIRTLFIGNGYYPSDLCTPILDYDRITIEPKAIENNNANMNTTDITQQNNQQNDQQNNNQNNNSNNSGSTNNIL